MAENNRLTKVSSIIRAYDTIMRAHRGEVLCTVTTAKVVTLTDKYPMLCFSLLLGSEQQYS